MGDLYEDGSPLILSKYCDNVIAIDKDPICIKTLNIMLRDRNITNVVPICDDYKSQINLLMKKDIDYMNVDPCGLNDIGDKNDLECLTELFKRIPLVSFTVPIRGMTKETLEKYFGIKINKKVKDTNLFIEKILEYYEEKGVKFINYGRTAPLYFRLYKGFNRMW